MPLWGILFLVLLKKKPKNHVYCTHVCTTQHTSGGGEDSWQELVLSFHHVGPSELTEVVRLDGESLYLENCLLSLF